MAWVPFITSGLVFLVGIIGISAFPNLDTADSEQLVGMMASTIAGEHVIFYWAMVILFGGIIAAIISTADSALLAFSSIISKDLYGRFIHKHAPEKKKILVGKLAGIVAVGLLLIIAWNPPGTLYQIFVLKFELLIQIAPAFILGLYWPRLHRAAVFAGMLAGALTASTMAIVGVSPFGIHSGTWGLLLNVLICVVGSFILNVSEADFKRSKEVIELY